MNGQLVVRGGRGENTSRKRNEKKQTRRRNKRRSRYEDRKI